MRQVWISLLVALSTAGVSSAQPARSGVQRTTVPPREVFVSRERLDRLEAWLKAVDRHEPGEIDDAVSEVGEWTESELRDLWVDAKALVALLRNRKAEVFQVGETPRSRVRVYYAAGQLQRMRALACAAAGLAFDRDCVAMRATTLWDADIAQLAAHVSADRDATGEDNYVLRRGALLHADAAMLVPAAVNEGRPPGATAPIVGPQELRVDSLDGIDLDIKFVGVHWQMGRTLLDAIRPRGEEKVHPERDAMVRDWYRATAAWMLFNEDHSTKHFDRAREIFPNDPDILYLSGCQHEAYAGPAIQSAVRTAPVPTGFSMDIETVHAELRRAEGFFRAALAREPTRADARLHLGRVLTRLERYADAATELRSAREALDDPEQHYFADLFLGAAEGALGRFDAAEEAYERAADAYPRAQSPLIGLSELARRRGDREAALRWLQKVFALADDLDRSFDDDLWWSYLSLAGREADDWLDALRRPFRRDAQ